MIFIDTSAWIEYFRDSRPEIVRLIDQCLEKELVAMGDLVYCEVMQGISSNQERQKVSSLFLSLPKFDMVGFKIATNAADNYRLLREKGLTIRKTIDVIIGTFCVEHDFSLIHFDRDFDLMAKTIGLKIYQ